MAEVSTGPKPETVADVDAMSVNCGGACGDSGICERKHEHEYGVRDRYRMLATAWHPDIAHRIALALVGSEVEAERERIATAIEDESGAAPVHRADIEDYQRGHMQGKYDGLLAAARIARGVETPDADV